MGVCFEEKTKKKEVVLDESEKAILECKKCRDKIKSYINRLSNRAKKSHRKNERTFKIKRKR